MKSMFKMFFVIFLLVQAGLGIMFVKKLMSAAKGDSGGLLSMVGAFAKSSIMTKMVGPGNTKAVENFFKTISGGGSLSNMKSILGVATGGGSEGGGTEDEAVAEPPELLFGQYKGIEKEQLPILDVYLSRAMLTGKSIRGEIWGYKDFLGAKLTAEDPTGQNYSLRLDGLSHKKGIAHYRVSYHDEGTKKWENVCASTENPKTEAFLLKGRWMENGDWEESSAYFTIACEDHPLGQCVELGYNPWKAYAGVPLAEYHQACVRMLKADYLGNGNSFLTEGEAVAFEDNLGIHREKISRKMEFEAGWGPEGAVNIGRLYFKDKPPKEIKCDGERFCQFVSGREKSVALIRTFTEKPKSQTN